MSTGEKISKSLTGKQVLFMVLGFFAVIVAANAFMIAKSITSFRGEDTKKSYLQGLHYNDTLEERAAQKAAGWTAALDYSTEQVRIQIRDGSNTLVSALNLEGKLRHPTDTSEDLSLEFIERGDGTYLAKIDKPVFGQRTLVIRANTNEGFEFSTRNELWLQ
ncbi:MAG: hypothetical protein EX271_02820 [Acidimicrobiales bacterium]|nr:FixH family protein [Hyphomonadaceae bacterium]RZV43953.1 MAG: hypothetical protein EX271_02820 [Acidimicrobiales bacterium]